MYYDIQEKPFSLANNLHLMERNLKEIIQNENLYNFEENLPELTERCLLKLTFDVGEQFSPEQAKEMRDKINENLKFIIENVASKAELVAAIKQKIYKAIDQE